MKWIKFSKNKPEKRQIVDIWIKGKGRENNYEYDESGFLYDNELDLIREFGEEILKATHWMPVPAEPSE